MADAREIKTRAGYDSVGVMTGVGIMSRLQTETYALYADAYIREAGGSKGDLGKLMALRQRAHDQSMSLCQFRADTFDTNMPWWTDAGRSDAPSEVADRMHALLSKIRFAPDSVIIVAGHSLLFRNLFRTYAAPPVRASLPEFGEQKVPNCGVVKAELDFGDGQNIDGCISSLELLFGASLVQKPAMSVRSLSVRSLSPSPMRALARSRSRRKQPKWV